MAILMNNILGNLSGRIGNFVARTRNGKTYLCAYPEHYKASQAPHCVAHRNKFRTALSFSKNVYAIEELRVIWNDFKKNKQSGWNALVQANFKLTGINHPSISNIITPAGFIFYTLHSSISGKKVVLKIAPVSESTPLCPGTKNMLIIAVFCNYNPYDQTEERNAIFSYRLISTDFRFDKPEDINFQIDPAQYDVIQRYKNHTMYYAFITFDAKGYLLQYSKTGVIEF